MRKLVFLPFLFFVSPAHPASFDCRAAEHPSDIAICHHEELSFSEERYVESYQDLIARGGETARKGKNIASRHMSERRRCNGDPHCIYEAFNRARSEMYEAVELDDRASDNSGSSESRSWKSLEKIPAEQLQSLILSLEDECRGGTTMLAVERCDERNEIYEYMKRMRDMCYGRDSEYSVDYTWHKCGPGSN